MNSLDRLVDRTGRALATLPFRDREVLMLRFGIDSAGYVYSPAEIGKIWRKDERWARRTVTSALAKLRAKDPGVTEDELRVLHAAGCAVPSAPNYW
jgi:DNA-directed RNA polymerase sigma subunit (sigma70/sigma32)